MLLLEAHLHGTDIGFIDRDLVTGGRCLGYSIRELAGFTVCVGTTRNQYQRAWRRAENRGD